MNKRVLLFLLMLAASHPLLAHKQHVHQYIVREAYELLRAHAGKDIPEMHDHIGGLEPFYAADSAWQRPFVTTGAWREDEEDVVYGHRDISPIFSDLAIVSITHFWDADNGDFVPNMFRVHPVPLPLTEIGPYENAYQKLLKYANGGWIIWYRRAITAQNRHDGHILEIKPTSEGIPVAYHSLTAFYRSKILSLQSDQGSYVIFDVTDQKVIPPGDVEEVLVQDDTRDHIAWEILGRMCHLLGDLSVPAHAHSDEHGLDHDDYEEWMGGATDPYLEWNHENVGYLVDPLFIEDNPLHYLMYTMQQRADRFHSNGPFNGDGDDHFGGNPRQQEVISLTSNYSLSEPPANAYRSLAQLENIRDYTLPYAIRSTAGLLYWFASGVGLLPPVNVDIAEASR